MPDTTPSTPSDTVARRVLRREMRTFFVKLRTAVPGWPGVSEQDFIDGLADALTDMAHITGKGSVAYLQTLVHELQDRANQRVTPTTTKD